MARSGRRGRAAGVPRAAVPYARLRGVPPVPAAAARLGAGSERHGSAGEPPRSPLSVTCHDY